MIKWLKLLASWSQNELDCPNHEWGIYPLRGHGIREPDTVLEPLKCKNMRRWDGVCLGQSRLIILWLDTSHAKYVGIFLLLSSDSQKIPADVHRSLDLAEISRVRLFTPGVKLWKQFELQKKTCCVFYFCLILKLVLFKNTHHFSFLFFSVNWLQVIIYMLVIQLFFSQG